MGHFELRRLKFRLSVGKTETYRLPQSIEEVKSPPAQEKRFMSIFFSEISLDNETRAIKAGAKTCSRNLIF